MAGHRKLIPSNAKLVGWIDFDLRFLRQKAITLAKKHHLKAGQALLVSGGWYKGARRCMFLLQTPGGPMVVTTQTENEAALLVFLTQIGHVANAYFETS